MKRYIIGIHNGFDVDDYYISAETEEEAVRKAIIESGGEVFIRLKKYHRLNK